MITYCVYGIEFTFIINQNYPMFTLANGLHCLWFVTCGQSSVVPFVYIASKTNYINTD